MSTVCPSCDRKFPDGAPVCPDDGARTLTVRDTDPMLGTVLDGRFRIERKLGEGGMGAVYVGVQTSIGREVAIKVMRPESGGDEEAIKRFGREAQVVARLTHGNIVQLYDFGRTPDGLLYLAMEFVRGRSLTDLLAHGPLEGARAAAILGQVCDALGQAHDQGIVHRDLKPDNILLVSQAGNADHVKVLDFGIAKVMDGGAAATALTAAGSIIGTPQYMSPEQVDGSNAIGPCTDLYALGVIAFEMLAGAPPFTGDMPIQLLIKHLKDPPPRLSDVAQRPFPEAVEACIARALSKQPEDRCRDAQQFKAELQGAFGLLPAGLAGTTGTFSAAPLSATPQPTVTGRMPEPAMTLAAPPPRPKPRPSSTDPSATIATDIAAAAVAPTMALSRDEIPSAVRRPTSSAQAVAAAPEPPTTAPAKDAQSKLGLWIGLGVVAVVGVGAAVWLGSSPAAAPVAAPVPGPVAEPVPAPAPVAVPVPAAPAPAAARAPAPAPATIAPPPPAPPSAPVVAPPAVEAPAPAVAPVPAPGPEPAKAAKPKPTVKPTVKKDKFGLE